MKSDGHDPFVLKDHFGLDPFNVISRRPQVTDDFFYAYADYRQYLEYLAIIWYRLNDESKKIGMYHAEELKISYEERPEEWRSLIYKKDRMQTIVYCDFEAFILFSRRFMDKVAKLIEQLIEFPNEERPPDDFNHHKKWIIKHSKIHPAYSKFLEEKAYWYERDLRLYRNKVVAHGGTLTSGMSVSPHTGIGFIRSVGISPLQGEDKDDFLRIKRTYEMRDPRIKILENDYEMLNDFVLAITQYDVRLDDPDLICLGKIIQRSGVRVNVYYLETIAKHIEDFLQETASIFK